MYVHPRNSLIHLSAPSAQLGPPNLNNHPTYILVNNHPASATLCNACKPSTLTAHTTHRLCLCKDLTWWEQDWNYGEELRILFHNKIVQAHDQEKQYCYADEEA